ncbi:protein of unknown function [Taphrina deformans PYCC 5710]|uniref:CRAL-TRIO domain-containing protein n=1 Tax=Taphrina deformans (strain PYCC 5710 / ATCC 11124 / CBS 356.35 / IMI 108563 / JCM 9778 / NBRC 8474) TaxID=1097556 RepID=R4XFK7_TAPDE|nr:protein of unknown function [Taphrina deformans PYCC 5710]|eukprot:CCG83267.1 protein of unknown function [Taphrina deformans PYCC 5710]
MADLANTLCYLARPSSPAIPPLFVLSLPDEDCDFDDLLPRILHIIDCEKFAGSKSSKTFKYELLIFCASGHHRPSWPWLIQAFSKLDKKYKKALQKLYLVHEKSWVRVCMQLLENVVSPKFARKVRHVKTLAKLHEMLGDVMLTILIPDRVLQYDLQTTQDNSRPRKPRRDVKQSDHAQAAKSSACTTDDDVPSKPAPPTIPAARVNSRAAKKTSGSLVDTTENSVLPSIPPRRSSSTRTQETRPSSRDSVIFEDPEDEDAANTACMNLQTILKQSIDEQSTKPVPGHRSSSAPTVVHPNVPRASQMLPTNKAQMTKAPATLRRAISGPLTPSSGMKQNFLLPDPSKPPPKIKIHGKEVRVKTRKLKPGESEGRVGGLKALFEERALVAQSMA